MSQSEHGMTTMEYGTAQNIPANVSAASADAPPESATRISPLSLLVAMPPRYACIIVGAALLTISGQIGGFLPQVGAVSVAQLLGAVTTLATLASFSCWKFAAFAPGLPPFAATWYRRLRGLVVATALTLVIDAAVLFLLASYVVGFLPLSASYWNDVVSFTHVNAELVLTGHNPYMADSEFSTALRRFPQAPPTPLRGSTFGTGDAYPLPDAIKSAERQYLRNPRATPGGFDPATLHSYPALSFLLYIPALAIGRGNVLLLHIVVYCALLLWMIARAPRGIRGWAALTAVASSVPILVQSLMIDSEIVCLAFVLAAWCLRDRRWSGPIVLGLACAFKQYCWLFVPFILVETLLGRGPRWTARYLVVALIAFLVPNIPFMMASPQAWLHSIVLPATDPLFPMGIGIVALSIGKLLPFAPPALYTLLELASYGVALYAQIHWRERFGDGVLLLALVPLVVAFRSPANYFAVAPWIALYAVNQRYAVPSGTSSIFVKMNRVLRPA